MRYLVAISVALLAFAGAAAWVVDVEPDWLLRTRYPLQYEGIVMAHARNYDLDPALLAAVIYAESRFDPNAESTAGAVGLMQLLPETAKGIALRTGGTRFVVADLRDPEINVRYGSWGVVPLFTAVVLGITWIAIVFAAITWRYDDGKPASGLAVT
jgi:soluble lytic murein transglycosylase